MVTKVYLHTLATPGVWLFTLVSLVAALLPDVVIRQMKFIFIILSGKHFTDQANRNNIHYLISGKVSTIPLLQILSYSNMKTKDNAAMIFSPSSGF